MPRWYSWVSRSILSRIVDKFNLSDQPDNVALDWVLQKSIQPITSVDELLRGPKVSHVTVDLDQAAAFQTIWTVPAGKRWHLNWARKPATTAAAGLYISDGTYTATIVISQTATGVFIASKPIAMEEGWVIQSYNTDNIGDAARLFEILYEEEDAY